MKNNTNKNFWQKYAHLYDRMMKTTSNNLYGEICSLIKPHLSPEQNVLELACGTGQLSFPLAGSVQLWEATDFSPAMISEAKKKSGPAQLYFSIKDATALPYPEATFDVVVIANALHIMPDPEAALKEIHRVLKPGGILYAPTFIHGKSTGAKLRIHIMTLFGFKVFHKWDASQFSDFIKQHQFQIINSRIIGRSLAPMCYLTAQKIH